ncbi:MAG: ABC transporter ATP-binding protein [Victivallales bacterium]|nr:ABC transporter ATP-binding protein [Victivallales bacterium]
MTESTQIEPEVVVEASGLSKTFRDFWNRPKAEAVIDIDFKVHQGEVFGFLGPNGSGKSTTVKIMLGLLYPSGGAITVFGQNPNDVRMKKRLGYLPEESYLYKYLTATETLDFYGALFNLSKAERKSRIEQLLDMVGLAHARNRSVGEFSKGMARRIGLAQAMINDPDLLILDEPTSGLDPLGCKEIKNLILLMKERGKTVIVCSHLLSDIEDICDKVMILYGGKIRAQGTLDELLTVSNINTITVPSLSADQTKKLLSVLRKELKNDEILIDHPRRTLDEYFLSVVETAIGESAATSGVVSGGKIAEYLTEETNTKVDKDAILEALAPPNAAEPDKDSSSIPDEGNVEEKEEAIAKLADLVVDSDSKDASAKDEKDEDASAKTKKANEKLKHLTRHLDS